MTLSPADYLFIPFNSRNFPDLFDAIWVASLVLLVALIVLYNVRTGRLHRHPPYLDLWEWLLWTGIITFSLVLIGAVFVFAFVLILAFLLVGLGVMVWIRFRRFPPILAGYELRLARQRYFSRTKFAHPESTIRTRPGRRSRRRR